MRARENAPNGSTIEIILDPGEVFGGQMWPEDDQGPSRLVIPRTVGPAVAPNLRVGLQAQIDDLNAAIAAGLKVEPWTAPPVGTNP